MAQGKVYVLPQQSQYCKQRRRWRPSLFRLSLAMASVSQFYLSVQASHNFTHIGNEQAATNAAGANGTEKITFSMAKDVFSDDIFFHSTYFPSLADQSAQLRKTIQDHDYTHNVTRSLLGGHAQDKRWPDYKKKKGATIGIVNAMDSEYRPYFDRAVEAWQDANRVHKRDSVHFERSGGRTKDDCEYGIKHKVIICNGNYGATRWVGLEITISVGKEILKSRIKMNDNYLLSSDRRYNRDMREEHYDKHSRSLSNVRNPSYMQYCVCHELGHALGLAHQDENFSNDPTGSCLDYTRDISSSQQPNEIDYDELTSMYGVFDKLAAATTPAAGAKPPPVISSDASNPVPVKVPVPAPVAPPTKSPTAAPTEPPCCSFDQKICGRDATTFTMQPMCDSSQHHCENVCFGFWQSATERRMIQRNTPNCIATYAPCNTNPNGPVCCGNAKCSSIYKWCEPTPAGDALLVSDITDTPEEGDQYVRQRHRSPQSRQLTGAGSSFIVSNSSTERNSDDEVPNLNLLLRSHGQRRVLLSDRLDLNAVQKDINYSSKRYGMLIGEGENTLHFAKQVRRRSRSNEGQPLIKYVDVHFLLVPPPLTENEG